MSLAVVAALGVSSIGAILSVFASAALQRRQQARARRLAGYSVAAWLSFLPVTSLAALASAASSVGPESKAFYLARGISEGLNASALHLPFGIVAFGVWIASRKRPIDPPQDAA